MYNEVADAIEDEGAAAADGVATAMGRRSKRTRRHDTTVLKRDIRQDCPIRKRANEVRNHEQTRKRQNVGNAAIATVSSMEDEGGC